MSIWSFFLIAPQNLTIEGPDELNTDSDAIFFRHCFKKVENNIRGDLNKEHGDVKNLQKLISVVPCLFGT